MREGSAACARETFGCWRKGREATVGGCSREADGEARGRLRKVGDTTGKAAPIPTESYPRLDRELDDKTGKGLFLP